jgi:GNAT superfamily N-acetyltransferase
MVSEGAPHGGVTIRQATVADIPDLVRLRRMMFEAMGHQDTDVLDATAAASAVHLTAAIPAGGFYGWVAVASTGEVVASGGVIIDRHLPTPGNPSGRIGYVLNMVTDPAYRRGGIARRILRTMLVWLEGQGIQQAVLHASDHGRPLYEALGFEPIATGMQLELRT